MSTSNWQNIYQKNFRDLNSLVKFLELDNCNQEKILKNPSLPINIPYRIAEKIAKNDITDPLFMQFVPTTEEIKLLPGFVKNPVGDKEAQNERYLKKYHARGLLICTPACGMHCRFCFRQHFNYLPEDNFSKELQIINNDPSLEEIILSGGDPLSMREEALEGLLNQLDSVPHLQRIRFHTRFPIGIPERIDDRLVKHLQSLKKQVIFVVHINHPKELDVDVLHALGKLQVSKKNHIPVLCQSVLLKGINDNEEVLIQLYQRLINHGIIPYYLHQLDKVQGASHFEVPVEIGRSIIKRLQEKLPGYGVPRYAREVTGEMNKTFL